MFTHWIREHFKDNESARATICWVAGFGACVSLILFTTGMLLV